MSAARCDVKGCDFVVHHARQGYANALLGKHRRSAHGIISPHQAKYGRAADLKKQQARAAARALSRISESQPAQQPEPPRFTANLCPNCGCPIRAVVAALNLRTNR